MKPRYAMPIVSGRGAGLGNEMIVWSKAFVAAQVLDLNLLHPAWGLNPRGYRDYFGTSRLDWLTHRLLRKSLPLVRFEEADYRRLANGNLAEAVRLFGEEKRLRDRGAFVLGLSGLWGGYDILAGAREFLRAELLHARGTIANLYEIDRRLGSKPLRIGFHVRRGDFGVPLPLADYRNRFNVAIPLDWYVSVARAFAGAFGEDVAFLVVSDASPAELGPLHDAVPCVTTSDLPHGDISDMLALADCDFILCSISSYSLWSVFFSGGRYGWFAPNLTARSGLLSIWGHEPAQAREGGETGAAETEVTEMIAAGNPVISRGVALGIDGALPRELIDHLAQAAQLKRRATDLMRYGVAVQAVSTSGPP